MRSRHEAQGWEPPVWAQLIVSPKRAREIHEKLWPEDEMRGRPGRIYSPQPGETLKQRIPKRTEEAVEEEEPDAIPAWRKTFEFTGDEDALADESEVAMAAD
jgi:hypothetical protein